MPSKNVEPPGIDPPRGMTRSRFLAIRKDMMLTLAMLQHTDVDAFRAKLEEPGLEPAYLREREEDRELAILFAELRQMSKREFGARRKSER